MKTAILALLALIAAALGPLASPARADEAVALSGGYGLLNAPRAPRAAIVLIPGGNGWLGIRPDGSFSSLQGNQLVRTRKAYAAAGVASLVIDSGVSVGSAVTYLRQRFGRPVTVAAPPAARSGWARRWARARAASSSRRVSSIRCAARSAPPPPCRRCWWCITGRMAAASRRPPPSSPSRPGAGRGSGWPGSRAAPMPAIPARRAGSMGSRGMTGVWWARGGVCEGCAVEAGPHPAPEPPTVTPGEAQSVSFVAEGRGSRAEGHLPSAWIPFPSLRSAGDDGWWFGRVTVPRGPSRIAGYFDAEGLIVIDRVADRFGVSKAQLADTMGVSPETFHRAARAKAPKTQGRAAEMIEIVARVSDWAGGEKQALAWYRAEPLPAFGGRTAESLVKDGKAAAVRDWLDHVATGASPEGARNGRGRRRSRNRLTNLYPSSPAERSEGKGIQGPTGGGLPLWTPFPRPRSVPLRASPGVTG